MFYSVNKNTVEGFAGVLVFDFGKSAAENNPGVVDKGDVVAELFGRGHVVGGEYDGGPFGFEAEDFAFEDVGIDRVEAAEGFVEDEELGVVEHGDDELDLLLHAFGEFFDGAVPPAGNVETFEPLAKVLLGSGLVEAFEAGEVDGLLAHTHFFVETALFGEVADMQDIVVGHGVTVEEDGAAVGGDNAVDDADERCLAGSVGAEKTENGAAADVQGDIVEGLERAEGFGYVVES